MLTVEDGSGLTTADCYISVADATAYFTAYGGLDNWTAIDAGTQEVLLRKSARDLDTLYGLAYAGTPLSSAQALLFPRASFYDKYGRVVTGLPKAVAQACAELAIINSSIDATGVSDISGNIKMQLTKIDVIIDHTEYFAPRSASSAALRKVALLLAPYLIGGSGLYAQVVRG